MKTAEQRQREADVYREEGRKARQAGKTIASCPYYPSIGVPPADYVSPGENWIAGWREEDDDINSYSGGSIYPNPDPLSDDY